MDQTNEYKDKLTEIQNLLVNILFIFQMYNTKENIHILYFTKNTNTVQYSKILHYK